MAKVEHVQFAKGLNHKVMLRELADDDDLESIIVFCKWKDGTLSTGNSGIACSDMALGALMLQANAMKDSEIEPD